MDYPSSKSESKLKKLLKWLSRHKILTAIILLTVIGGYYFFIGNKKAVVPDSYTLGKVEKGAVLSSVSGSGSVSSSNQVDIKPKISADILNIYVKAGEKVKAGDLLSKLNGSDLQRLLSNAGNSLSIARANLDLKLAGATPEDIKIAANSVVSAKISYDNAVTNLETVKQTNDFNIKKSQLNLDNSTRAYQDAQANQGINVTSDDAGLANAYASAKSALTGASTNLRNALVTADNILGYNYFNSNTHNYTFLLGARDSQTYNDAKTYFLNAKSNYDNFEISYQSLASDWDRVKMDTMLDSILQNLEISKKMTNSTYKTLMSSVTGTDFTQTELDGFKSSITSAESALTSSVNSIQSAKQGILSAKLALQSSGVSGPSSISSAKNALELAQSNFEQAKLDADKSLQTANDDITNKKMAYENAQAQYNLKVAPPRDVDIAALKLQISQAQTAYQQAVEDFNNTKITAPFDGTIAKVYQNPGDAGSSANPIVTVITDKSLATVTLNEVDVSKAKVGQRATLTFSAIDGLEISGEVVEIDSIGTVTQNVVSYNVKIAFDTQDDRIKPQMSVSATIITDEKLDVLVVPNSAIKTDNSGLSYVEVLTGNKTTLASGSVTSSSAPEKKYVEVGLANDANTEIISGLSLGDEIIFSTITNTTTATTASTQRSGLQMLGGGGGGAGAARGAMGH